MSAKSVFYRIIMALLLVQGLTFASAKTQNLAKYRVVTHSSSIDVNKCGHLVVDGNPETYWESHRTKNGFVSGNEWLLIDLAEIQPVDSVTVHWGRNYATEYKISLHAKRGDTGREVFATNEGAGGDLQIDCDGAETRYIRLEIADVNDKIRGCVISEIEVLGTAANERFLPAETISITEDSLSLNGSSWRVQSAAFLKDESESIANTGYNDADWIPARVPGTVMGSYHEFGALPDPLYGDNMHQISDEFFSGNDFWYRSKVEFSQELRDRRLFLDFSGINWKADIFFNGKRLGEIEGAFHRGSFDVTDLVRFSEANTVAVLVHHPDSWVSGEFKVLRKTLGARTTNGDMLGMDGPTSVASAGWNWLPIIRGRNTGIWNNVTFRVGGDVTIKDPWVSTELPLPDNSQANLTIRTELENHTSVAIEGKLLAAFGDIEIELPARLEPNETKTFALDPSQFSELRVSNPKLWWPNGYGAPNLHELSLKFVTGGHLSDSETINFGIRDLEYKLVDNVLFFYCNGTRLLLRGGNWGLPEAMLRCDSDGYDLRVRLHKEANLNMIRNWVGMTPHEEFYDACDRYGMLIFDDFWLAHPMSGPDPRDQSLFIANVRDKIKWVRKHPSLAIYCGRNEGAPPLELDIAMEEATQSLDGTRLYIPDSAAGTVTGYGPYDVRPTEWYFENRGRTFHSEQGVIAIPEVESLRRMMPEKDLWPISDMWAVHNYQQGRSEKFTDTVLQRYGTPESVEDYSRLAQLHNYESVKAIFESLQSNQGSGVLLWMSQSAWPSLICQLYDHYFEYTAAYFAVKKAAAPVHVFWDPVRGEIRIANNTADKIDDATVTASVYSSKGKILWQETKTLEIGATKSETCFDMGFEAASETSFLKLEMVAGKRLVADNFYWVANREGHCLDLDALPSTDLELEISGESFEKTHSATIKLRNTSPDISLLNKIKLKDERTGESILPVFFDDDYISLLPGETRTIRISIEANTLGSRKPVFHIEGFNTESKAISYPVVKDG